MMLDWTRDALPSSQVDVQTHQIERGRDYHSTRIIDDRAPQYAIEFSTQHLIDKFSTELKMRAVALYGYARFKDESLSDSFAVPHTTTKPILASGRDHAKAFIERQISRVNTAFINWHYRHQQRVGPYDNPVNLRVPKQWKPQYKYVDIVTSESWDICIKRIQEALANQVILLRHYGLEPQAVLASPEIARHLVAANWMDSHMSYDSRLNYVSTCGQGCFFGLRVIVCEHLKWGAIVV